MEFHPEKRDEILAKRKEHRLVKTHSRQSVIPIRKDSPLAMRLGKLSTMDKEIK